MTFARRQLGLQLLEMFNIEKAGEIVAQTLLGEHHACVLGTALAMAQMIGGKALQKQEPTGLERLGDGPTNFCAVIRIHMQERQHSQVECTYRCCLVPQIGDPDVDLDPAGRGQAVRLLDTDG